MKNRDLLMLGGAAVLAFVAVRANAAGQAASSPWWGSQVVPGSAQARQLAEQEAAFYDASFGSAYMVHPDQSRLIWV